MRECGLAQHFLLGNWGSYDTTELPIRDTECSIGVAATARERAGGPHFRAASKTRRIGPPALARHRSADSFVRNPALLPITLIVFIDVLGFAVVIPLLPFQAQRLGATPAVVGALIASYALCSLFTGPLLGRWSDRYGRKPVLLLSQFGSLLGFVMLALAPSLVWLFLARALDGLTAGNLPTARACISDVTAPQDRSAAFGLIAAAFGFGFMIGPAGAGLLSHLGPAVPLWVAAALSALSMLCTWRLLPARAPHPAPATVSAKQSMRELVSEAGIAPQLWQWFLFIVAFSVFTAGFALFCERRLQYAGEAFGPTQVGLVLAYLGTLGLIAQLAMLKNLVRRFGEARVVGASFAAGSLSYLALGFTQGLPLLLVSLGLIGMVTSLLRPSLLGLISQQVAASRQGAVFGLTQSLQSLAMILGPLIAGALIHYGWLSGWAWTSAALLLLALVGMRRAAAPVRRLSS